MGIRGLKQWLRHQFPLCTAPSASGTYDVIVFDLNALIHAQRAAHSCHETLTAALFRSIIDILSVHCRPNIKYAMSASSQREGNAPTLTIIFCLDGPPPSAKLPEQRARRTPGAPGAFDVTVGSVFMTQLSHRLSTWAATDLPQVLAASFPPTSARETSAGAIPQLRVVVSGSQTEGEGETKAVDMVAALWRLTSASPGTGPGTMATRRRQSRERGDGSKGESRLDTIFVPTVAASAQARAAVPVVYRSIIKIIAGRPQQPRGLPCDSKRHQRDAGRRSCCGQV
eukprot:TRINITY_DN3976_c0_g2_i1.p1 TRINITY_DN3976_c0_g2~~TRINITY_DN3976_c0_g2_i1.p1  ORF type:complete len:284 (+),score=25.14 TRINITY_DN3976_c0_g2_i1:125-976(+)